MSRELARKIGRNLTWSFQESATGISLETGLDANPVTSEVPPDPVHDVRQESGLVGMSVGEYRGFGRVQLRTSRSVVPENVPVVRKRRLPTRV